jgi:hypothetical protein
MKIVDLFTMNHNVRLSMGDKWLYWDDSLEMWVVREHKKYKRNSTIEIETESEEEAVDELIKQI